MKSIEKCILLFSTFLIISSCDLLQPVDDNHSTFDRVLNDPGFAEGLLITAYTKIPTNGYSYNEVATDDAVSNDKFSSYLRMATGEWSSMYNPVNQWDNCLSAIQAINEFMLVIEEVNWKGSIPEINELYIKRFKGEAYGLRALFKYHLLVSVAGVGANGELLGIPILNQFLENTNDFNIPRAGFTESVNSIYEDIAESLTYLTMDNYVNIQNSSDLPDGYRHISPSNYNIVFGKETAQRISGRYIKALRAKTALLAASPAFSDDPVLWAKAASYAGEFLKDLGGENGLDPEGHKFYHKEFVDKLNVAADNPIDQKEIIWRRPKGQSNSREVTNFPPSLFGNGRINPTQNLVDAFPMENGYPITDKNSGYDPEQPYAGRDPRLGLYIMVDGSSYKGQIITTGLGGKENAKDSIATSTRTGYYLKKLLVEEVNLDPTATSTQWHYEVHMRYTELYLIYAEAANEAWGPDGSGSFGFSARDIIAAIRQRAGIIQPDEYLNSILTKEDMRKLIRNERRLELCFEGFRFWDLRRWKENLTEPAKGINISDSKQYVVIDVEQRSYSEHMYYGPLPNQDIIKYNALIQNKGW